MTDLVQATIDRLEAEVSALQGVDGALELADLLGRDILPQRFPWAFVLDVGFDAEGNALAVQALRQRVTETVGVLIVHKHAGSRTGAETRTALEPVETAVINALANWQAGAELGPMELVRGRLVGMAGGAAFKQIDFRAEWHLRKEAAA